MYRQVVDPVGSPALSAALAALPLVVLLVLLGVVRMKSHWAALIGLATAVLIAVGVYGMPLGQAADGAVEGAAFGLFPIVWIILNAVWISKLQRSSGHFDIIGRTFSSLSRDTRVQAILIAYCFGSMIESLAGFGTPIAITSIMLMGLGLKPLKAAAVATFANTAPAAFGSLGNPIQALAKVTSFPEYDLGAMTGRQSAIIAALVPFVLLLMMDGRRGLREAWPAALTAGVGFGVGQFLCSNYFTYQICDLAGAVVATGAVIVLLRFWPGRRGATMGAPVSALAVAGGTPAAMPADGSVARSELALSTMDATGGHHLSLPDTGTSPGTVDGNAPAAPASGHRDSRLDVLKAFSPYILLTALFALTAVQSPIQAFVAHQAYSFRWPGLLVVGANGKPVAIGTFDLGWLGSAGTMLLITGALTVLILRVRPSRALRCYGEALHQIRWAVLTICCVLALSYVMNLAGMAISLGTWLAGLGAAFALLAGFLGWFGVALTGSDTSSNALFGAMQVAAAHRIGISPLLMAATNTTGGVQGKAAAMQNLAIAASAVGLSGREGDILRKVIGWSLGLLAVFCVLAFLQTTPVLSWMVLGS
ncbi:MAG: lactate permease [Pseudonocardiales bacterium]|nr:lactate permease [Pseudonocardiales bacterium]